VIALVATAIIVAAVVVSSRRGMAMADTPAGPSAGGPAQLDAGGTQPGTVPAQDAVPHTEHRA
jgi:hypothetical protein